MTKTFIYPIVKQTAKWLGIQVTKTSFSRSVAKIVPIIGGIVSGGLTYVTFKPQAKKLMRALRNTMITAYENKQKQ